MRVFVDLGSSRDDLGVKNMKILCLTRPAALLVGLLIVLALTFVWSAGVALADDQPDGSAIDPVQDVDGVWGPGVITATADVVINAGVVITIAPDTTVYFANGAGLTVNGDLHSAGPVTFTGVSATPGAWDGVTYAPGSTGYLSQATIEYAVHALTLNTANPITVSDSTLRNNRHAPTINQMAFGAGLYIQQGNHLIENTSIHANAATATGSGHVRGAGVYIVAGSPQILNSWVYENTATGSNVGAGGGVGILAGGALIENSHVLTNTLTGGGDAVLKSGGGIGFAGHTTVVIRDSWISGNSNNLSDGYAAGGGIGFAANSSASLIEGSVIDGNYIQGPDWCEGGGIDTWDTTNAVVIRNNLIANNTAGACRSGYGAFGGGVNMNGSATGVHLINNTIVGNVAGRGGGVYLQGGTVYARNNIVANNTSTIANQAGGIQRGVGTVEYNDIFGNTSPQTVGTMGAGNLYQNPRFLGAGDLAQQYHLSAWSPAIDAGTNTGAGLPTADYDGNPRPLHGGYDVGFDEVIPALTVSKSVTPEPVEPGQQLAYTIVVANDGQGDATDVTVTDPLPAGTTFAPGSSQVTLPLMQTYRDELTNRVYDGSNGALNWSGQAWTEIGESNDPITGDVQVLTDLGDYSIRIQNTGRGAWRLADLSGYTSAVLSFEYRRNSFDTANDYVRIEVSSDGGGAWVELDRLMGPATDSGYRTLKYDISGYIAANTAVRFVSSGMDTSDQLYIDNVQISAYQMGAGVAGDPPTLLSGATLNPGQRMTVTFAVTVNYPAAAGSLITNTASATSAQVSAPVESSVVSTVANVAPQAVDDDDATDEDTLLSGGAPGVLGNDSDLNGDPLTVTAYDASSANGASVTVNPDGSFSFDPTAAATLQALAVGETLVDSFTYTIDDGNGETAAATVNITVSGVNDPPVAADDSGATDEDTALTVAAPGVLSNDADADASDTLTVVAYDASSANGASVTVNPDGSFSFDPTTAATLQALAVGETLVDSFSYTISDGNGGSATATVSVTVSGVNDPPVAADDSAAADEDTLLTVAAPGVLSNDGDADASDTLAVTAYDASSANGAGVTVNPDGSFSFDPTGSATLQALAVGETLVDSFSYTISDGNGGSATATVSVIVSGVNDPPVAVDDSAATDEDVAVVVDVLANDSDMDTPILFVAAVGQAANGLTSINPDFSVTYTPTADFNGADTFTYTVGDGDGGNDTASVTITVNPVNDDPTAQDDLFVAPENSVNNVLDVRDNDTDAPDSGETLTIVALGTPDQGGSATTDGATVVYTPVSGFAGTETFTYTIGDGNGGSDAATVTVVVDDTYAQLTLHVLGGGAVSRDPDEPLYLSGAVVTLTASADPGWVFDGWSGDMSGTDNPAAITLLGNKEVTATFTYEGFHPLLSVVRTGPEAATVGDMVVSTFTVQHAAASDGSPVSDIVLDDGLGGTATLVSGDASGDGLLSAGEVWVLSASYTVQASDPNPLQATATVTGLDQEADTIQAQAPYSIVVSQPAPETYQVFLPLVVRSQPPAVLAPDLVVESVHVTSASVRVVIKNQGNAPVTDAFWVDLYVNPHPAPTGVNQVWNDGRSTQGMVWGVAGEGLPLEPGESLTLTFGDQFYWPTYSAVAWPLPVGTPIYVQVDSANTDADYGAVLESHEMDGGAYNNIYGPALSGLGAGVAPIQSGSAAPRWAERLPARPQ
jgi:uncharacterized repeat protein (TIGR01451 family)